MQKTKMITSLRLSESGGSSSRYAATQALQSLARDHGVPSFMDYWDSAPALERPTKSTRRSRAISQTGSTPGKCVLSGNGADGGIFQSSTELERRIVGKTGSRGVAEAP